MYFSKICLHLINKELRIEMHYLTLKEHYFKMQNSKLRCHKMGTRNLPHEQRRKIFFLTYAKLINRNCRDHILESGDLNFWVGWLRSAVIWWYSGSSKAVLQCCYFLSHTQFLGFFVWLIWFGFFCCCCCYSFFNPTKKIMLAVLQCCYFLLHTQFLDYFFFLVLTQPRR